MSKREQGWAAYRLFHFQQRKDKSWRYKHVQTVSLHAAEFRQSSFKQSEAIRNNPTTADIPRARWNLHSFGPARHMLLFELRQNPLISFDETAVPWILPDNREWGPYWIIFQAKMLPKIARDCLESCRNNIKKLSRAYYVSLTDNRNN